MSDPFETPYWKALELKPLNLDEIPDILQDFIYPEERKQGVIFPLTAYTIVLLLRWALSGPEDAGLEGEYEGQKVYWATEDKYGFRIKLFLFSEKEEQYDSYNDKMVVLQEQRLIKLGELQCNDGRGAIRHVAVKAFPYGWLEVDGVTGVRRLVEDAMISSYHTYRRAIHNGDRTFSERDNNGWMQGLSFVLRYDGEFTRAVTSIDVRAERSWV